MAKLFANLWKWIFGTTCIELSPYLIFLAVNTMYLPHDCFKCFGKDPTRKFSIYQYTSKEQKALEQAKRGKGALKLEASEAI